MATVKVEGFDCIDETGRFETGSNEIVFCFAAFGITNQQYDEFRRFETRLNTGVDSGEDQWFDEPIVVTVDENDGARPLTRLEIQVAAYEIEGRGATSTLARRLYERWRTALAEELYPNRPTTVVDFSDRFGSGADGTAEAVAASGDHALIMVEAWRLDIRDRSKQPAEPLEWASRTACTSASQSVVFIAAAEAFSGSTRIPEEERIAEPTRRLTQAAPSVSTLHTTRRPTERPGSHTVGATRKLLVW